MTKQEQLQKVFQAYQDEHNGVPAGTMEVAIWGVEKGLLSLPDLNPHAVLAEQMATALRNEYGTDAKTGRRYRKNHARVITKYGVQMALWAEMDTAPRDHMQKAFQQRRKQIVGDCVQLKADVDVYNSRNSDKEPIQLVIDFTDDVAEVEAALDLDLEEAA